MSQRDDITQVAETYYDSGDADNFYFHIWGGEDIHVGIYESENEPIANASARSVQQMASKLNLNSGHKVLDIGAGYGGAARYLAKMYGCQVVCLNLSDTENARNREHTKKQGLDKLVEVVSGDFENLPFEDSSFDVIWSEDAILHSGNKPQVFREATRVLKAGGEMIFTDPMQADHVPDPSVLEPILKRIHLRQMGSVKLYRELAEGNGLTEVEVVEMPEQLVNHYSSVRRTLVENEARLKEHCSEQYLSNMKAGLSHWVEGGKKGYLNWGILHFRKPAMAR